ncbi:hypothetical protein NS183_02880 [Microbacterium testaceum]|uniref:hypothetical protein n=1 Tax=Microbacterium testaceum TaxID=2033 RepID=UPI00073491A6|nr:hypothetical protein [Microbacterium testaceum]KTS91719.1 hypothetical protein NS183_02880 [Microbacterium testaceum]
MVLPVVLSIVLSEALRGRFGPMAKRMPRWVVIVLLLLAVLLLAGLLWVLVSHPELAAPIETVAVVVGTGFTAFAAWSAYRAARVSQGATIQSLRTERRALQVERAKLVADNATHEHWSMVEKDYNPGIGSRPPDRCQSRGRTSTTPGGRRAARGDCGDPGRRCLDLRERERPSDATGGELRTSGVLVDQSAGISR